MAFSGSSGGSISGVDVFFATGFTWAPFGGSATNFFTVALHEIGHAIGLEHVPDVDEIMNAVISNDLTDLGNGDIAAAQYLYGRDATDAPLADAEQVTDDPSPPGIPSDGGGGGGGALAAILGLLALVFGLLPAGAVAVAAGRVASDDEDAEDDAATGLMPELSDLIPTVPMTEQHVLYAEGYSGHTGHAGCTCGACRQQEMEEDNTPFLM